MMLAVPDTLSIAELMERLAALEAALAERDRVIDELRTENARLREENEQLRRRLGMTSRNSSKPPIVGRSGQGAAPVTARAVGSAAG
jgi:regulator of replication initiation timing